MRSIRGSIFIGVLFAICLSVYCSAQSTHHWALRHECVGRYNWPNDIAFFDSTRGLVAVNLGVLVTNDAGGGWTRLRLIPDTGRNRQITSIAVLDENTAWICGYEGILFRTSDGGTTFEDRSLPSEYDLESIFFIDGQTGWIAGDSNTTSTPIQGKGCIFKTTDAGLTWEVAAMFPPAIEDTPWIYWMDLHFTDSLNGWAVGTSGGVGRTTDGGSTWTLFDPAIRRDLFAVHALTEQHVFIGGENLFLAETTDGGGSWIARTKQPMVGMLFDIKIYPDGSGWIGGQGRTNSIFRTLDAGATWLPDTVRENESRRVKAITRTPDGRIWAVTEEGEILERVNRPVPTGITAMRPRTLALSAYPVPLPPDERLTLSIDLPEALHVSLDLYGLDGRKLLSLHEGMLDVGTHTLRTDGLSLVPGVYIARLRAGSEIRMAKILLAP